MLSTLLLLIASAWAQVQDPGAPVEARHMAILAGWSAANLSGGTAGWALADTREMKTFHASNAAWNTVNGGLALAGLAGRKRRRIAPDLVALAKRHRGLHTGLAINAGLDVGYMAAGAALWARGGESNGVPLAPVGQALVLQGAFLFAFDLAFLTSHKRRVRSSAQDSR